MKRTERDPNGEEESAEEDDDLADSFLDEDEEQRRLLRRRDIESDDSGLEKEPQKTLWDYLPDADEVFAYRTQLECNVMDRRLGYMFRFWFVVVSLYLIVGVFIINKGYLDHEKASGLSVITMIGSVYSNRSDGTPRVWDEADILSYPIEDNSIFIPVRVRTVAK